MSGIVFTIALRSRKRLQTLTHHSSFIIHRSSRRNQFSRIEPSWRIERLADAAHRLQIGGGEEAVHQRELLNADAVLGRNAAARRDALLQNLASGGHRPLDLLAVALVK